MPMDTQVIQQILEKSFPGAKVEVIDLVGDGDHLQALVISDLFESKTLLQQHQMVYGVLKEILKDQLHALALKTYTPEQWRKSHV